MPGQHSQLITPTLSQKRRKNRAPRLLSLSFQAHANHEAAGAGKANAADVGEARLA